MSIPGRKNNQQTQRWRLIRKIWLDVLSCSSIWIYFTTSVVFSYFSWDLSFTTIKKCAKSNTFYTIYNSFTFICKNELYPKRIEKVLLDEIKWTHNADSSDLRYVKLEAYLHKFLCHVTSDVKFFHMCLILFTLFWVSMNMFKTYILWRKILN